ncbi:hypothetical protein [Streptomyces globisporus]
MEIAELVLKYVDTLVWPLATVALVWGLRQPIKRAIARLSRLETPAGTMEFTEEVRGVRDDAEELAESAHENVQTADGLTASDERRSPEVDSPAVPEPRSSGERREDPTLPGPQGRRVMRLRNFQQAMEAVDVSPVGAVITAWAALEFYCVNALADAGIDALRILPGGKQAPVAVYGGLVELGVSGETLDVYDRLRVLRAKALKEPDSVSRVAARDFVISCQTVAKAVRDLAPHALSGMPGPP